MAILYTIHPNVLLYYYQSCSQDRKFQDQDRDQQCQDQDQDQDWQVSVHNKMQITYKLLNICCQLLKTVG